MKKKQGPRHKKQVTRFKVQAARKKAFETVKILILVPCALNLILILQAMKPVFKIGNSGDLDASQADLLMEIGETHCCFAITNHADQMMVQSVYYAAEEHDTDDILKTVLQAHPELKRSFRQTAIGYYMRENILVPSKLYHFEETKKLLQALYEKDLNTTISESVSEWQLYNTYNVPVSLHELLNRNFATGNFWHVYSIVLKNRIDPDEGGRLIADFKTDSFSVVVIKHQAILLAQIFAYSKPADILYWLLKICKEFSLSQNEVKLLISGLIDKRSAVYRDLDQYFLNIEFASIANGVRLSNPFHEYPVHFFSSLYKLAACVS